FGLAGSYVESVDAPGIEQPARRLIEALKFTGLIEIEFKRDPRDGRYKLLDINPRAWGWHSLGRGAGADFPYLLWQMIHGHSLAGMRRRAGVRWIRMSTDLQTVVREV